MKKIIIFTLYGECGASSKYRVYIFKDIFQKNFNVKWFNFWSDTYVKKYMHHKKKYFLELVFEYTVAAFKRWYQLMFVAPKADAVFIQKQSIPKIKFTYLQRCKKNGTKIIFDVDDAVYTDRTDNSNQIAEIADVVICGNNNLQKHYLKFNKNTIVLPTVERTDIYEPFWKDTFQKKVIGWIGSQTTLPNLDIIVEPINNVVKKHPEVRFRIISDDCGEYCKRIENCEFIPWEGKTYVKELSNFTIGIMPLIDNEINRGKCGFKLIQYLNMKKPVVGSDIGVNASIIEGNGLLANNSKEWEDAIERLLFSENLYRNYIEHINTDFFSKYHYEVVAKSLLKTIQDVIK